MNVFECMINYICDIPRDFNTHYQNSGHMCHVLISDNATSDINEQTNIFFSFILYLHENVQCIVHSTSVIVSLLKSYNQFNEDM